MATKDTDDSGGGEYTSGGQDTSPEGTPGSSHGDGATARHASGGGGSSSAGDTPPRLSPAASSSSNPTTQPSTPTPPHAQAARAASAAAAATSPVPPPVASSPTRSHQSQLRRATAASAPASFASNAASSAPESPPQRARSSSASASAFVPASPQQHHQHQHQYHHLRTPSSSASPHQHALRQLRRSTSAPRVAASGSGSVPPPGVYSSPSRAPAPSFASAAAAAASAPPAGPASSALSAFQQSQQVHHHHHHHHHAPAPAPASYAAVAAASRRPMVPSSAVSTPDLYSSPPVPLSNPFAPPPPASAAPATATAADDHPPLPSRPGFAGAASASTPNLAGGGRPAPPGPGAAAAGGADAGPGAETPPPEADPDPRPEPRGWRPVELSSSGGRDGSAGTAGGGVPPCQRSLHAAAVLDDRLYVFGGYDGHSRINDFHAFSFTERRWSPVLPSAGSGPPPTPRDRHVAVVWGNGFYVFGGFDGTSRVADFYGFDLSSMTWGRVSPRPPAAAAAAVAGGAAGANGAIAGAAAAAQGGGSAPSPRHSHSAVVHGDSMFVFGGYDGSYRSDFHEFHFPTSTWTPVPSAGRTPRARYRATCVVHRSTMILFGGHDGTRHLSDAHVFDFDARTWSAVVAEGVPPIPRDSHVSVVHRDSMYVFGGSTGSAMNDLHELRLIPPDPAAPGGGGGGAAAAARWQPVEVPASGAAGHRFCHVGVSYGDAMYVFGGYDGSNRLNDFLRYDFDADDLTCEVPASDLVSDLRSFLADDALADVTFVVEDRRVRAHKIMLMRCPYFRAMFLGDMKERNQDTVTLGQVRHHIFLLLLEYLYTDDVAVPLEHAMELFVAADQFDVPRLRAMCELRMLRSLTVENVATVFLAADLHSALSLRGKALKYILNHFETVSKTPAFEEMARSNVELVFEILKSR